MKSSWKLGSLLLTVAAIIVVGLSDSFPPRIALAQSASASGKILLAFGPGGVLTDDGTLWQYNMEAGVWVDVDEAFEEQGHQTHVHPLPVPVQEIARMESFGFLTTHSGNCWLYDLEKDQWREIGPPPSPR